MVRNYKRKTDKEYAWKVPRSRTWDAKKPKVELPEYEPYDEIKDWNGVDDVEDGYPLEDHKRETLDVLDYIKKYNIKY